MPSVSDSASPLLPVGAEPPWRPPLARPAHAEKTSSDTPGRSIWIEYFEKPQDEHAHKETNEQSEAADGEHDVHAPVLRSDAVHVLRGSEAKPEERGPDVKGNLTSRGGVHSVGAGCGAHK